MAADDDGFLDPVGGKVIPDVGVLKNAAVHQAGVMGLGNGLRVLQISRRVRAGLLRKLGHRAAGLGKGQRRDIPDLPQGGGQQPAGHGKA